MYIHKHIYYIINTPRFLALVSTRIASFAFWYISPSDQQLHTSHFPGHRAQAALAPMAHQQLKLSQHMDGVSGGGPASTNGQGHPLSLGFGQNALNWGI